MYTGHSRDVYDRLKSAITDTRERINRKNIEEYEVDICIHLFACSNSLNALHVDDEDRRWLFPRVGNNARTPEYWRNFYAWLRDGGLGIIRRWAEEFVKLPGGLVEPGERAPRSSLKTEVIAASRSAGQQLVFDLVDYVNDQPLTDGKRPAVVFAVEDVREWVASKRSMSTSDSRMEKPATIRKALVAAGMHEPEQVDGQPLFRPKVRGRKSHVVANFPLGPVTSWADISPSYREPKEVEPKDIEERGENGRKLGSPLTEPGDLEPF